MHGRLSQGWGPIHHSLVNLGITPTFRLNHAHKLFPNVAGEASIYST